MIFQRKVWNVAAAKQQPCGQSAAISRGETAKACGSFGRWQHQHQNLLRVLVNFNRYRDMDIVRFSNSCDADHYISYVFCFSGSFSGFHELPTRGVSRGSRRNQRRSRSTDAGHLGAGLRWHFWIDHSAGCVHLDVPQKCLIPVLLCIHIISTDILFSRDTVIQYLCSWVYIMIYNLNQHLHGEYKSYHSPFLCDFGISFQPNSLIFLVARWRSCARLWHSWPWTSSGVSNLFLPGFTLYEHGSLNVPIFHITQPLGIWSIMATIRWCPIYPKWDSYQPLMNVNLGWMDLPLLIHFTPQIMD